MAGVDLRVYRFDYDLTFAALLMNGDGTIYHRFGTRDHSSATSRLSMEAFVDLLRETLEDHALYEKAPSPPAPLPRRTIEGIPPMARKLQKKKVDCFHCHMVNDAERDLAREEGRYSREEVLGMWPLPDQAGFTVDPRKPSRVSAVVPGSAASRAGLEAGDRIHRMGSERVGSEADIQWVLENAPGDAARIPVEYERAGAPGRTSLLLEKGWKLAGAAAFSWRSSMWGLRPRPGFGGRQLGKDELKGLGLDEDAFALKVSYIVDWGEESYTGKNARKAGIQNGDVILSVAGKDRFASELEFQSWFRFTRKAGEKVPLEILRDGKRVQVELPVLE